MTTEQGKVIGNRFDTFLKTSTVSLIVLAAISLAFYLSTLGKRLSEKPEDWGAFGSYIGGILGPAVAFVALIAVLRTISLQREALAAQGKQFETIHKLQSDATTAQAKQLDLAEKSAEEQRILAFKSAALKVIECQIAYYEHYSREQTQLAHLVGSVSSQHPEVLEGSIKALKEITARSGKANARLSDGAELGVIRCNFEYAVTEKMETPVKITK